MKAGDIMQVDSTVGWARGLCKDPTRERSYEPVHIPGGSLVLLVDDEDVRFEDCYNVLWDGRVDVVERGIVRPVRDMV